jgi:hypothetical protein
MGRDTLKTEDGRYPLGWCPWCKCNTNGAYMNGSISLGGPRCRRCNSDLEPPKKKGY